MWDKEAARGESSVGGDPLRPSVTLSLRFVKLEETLDVVQSGFGLPTCSAHAVFKCLN